MSEKKEEIEEIVKKIKQQEEENDLFDFSFAQKDNSENVEQENQKKHNNDDLDKYIEEQLKNPEIIEFKKQTETEEWKEKKYPSFEKIMELKLPVKAIVGVIQRRKRIIIPNGATQIMGGDNLIIFTTSENAPNIKEFFEEIE